MNRREVIKGAGATAALLLCEPVAVLAVPLQSCGCPRVHEIAYGHTCVSHDKIGRRWDTYSIEEIADQFEIEVQTEDTEWSCYCGRHHDDLMPIGTRCIWQKVSYEYDEWECGCTEEFRAKWLRCQTTDWIVMMKKDETQSQNLG